jgi:uroporphyrinogen-III synthase
MKKIRIVCTRLLLPELKLQAGKRGVDISDHDFLAINYLDNEDIRRLIEDTEGEFIFTSVHAIKAVLEIANKHQLTFSRKICYCIAGPTSQLASAKGFRVKAEAGNALSLAKKIITHSPSKLVFFTGDIRTTTIEDLLESEKTELITRIVYEKKLLPTKAGTFDGVMFFSPSQVDAFLAENKLKPATPAFCIGTTTADHLRGKEHKNAVVAAASNSASVMDAVYNYFKI